MAVLPTANRFAEKMIWSHETVSGPYLIRPRFGHSISKVSESEFVVFGGSSGKDYFNDVHVFNICEWFVCSLGITNFGRQATRVWQRIDFPAGAPPPKRNLHSATFCDGNLYVFGGNRDGAVFNDMHLLVLGEFP